MHPTEATKTEAEHVPIGISFTDVMTHIYNCVQACVSTVAALSCLDGSIHLCTWWKTLGIASHLKQGKPKQALITLVLKNMAVPTWGHDSAHIAGTLHNGIHHCFRGPLWKELRAHTHIHTHTSCSAGFLISDRKASVRKCVIYYLPIIYCLHCY